MKRQLNPDQIFSCMMDAVVRQGGKDFQAIALGIRPLSQAALMWLQASEVWKRQETKTVDLMSDNALNETEKEYPFLMVTSVIKGKPEPLRTELKESFNETKQLYEDTCVDENDLFRKAVKLSRIMRRNSSTGVSMLKSLPAYSAKAWMTMKMR